VLTSVLLSAVAVALSLATAASTRGRSEVLAQAADRRQVSAELLEDASPLRDGSESVPEFGLATAVWTEPSGVQHTGALQVPVGAKAGSAHAIWIDRNGDRTTRPLSTRDVADQSVGIALLTFLGIALVAFAMYRSLRRLLERSRSRQWATEWAVVEPRWTGRVP
jgi:hypothetical protein